MNDHDLSMQENYLRTYGTNPVDYIISKFETKDVVLLAENHAVRDNLLFVHSLIPRLYEAGVYHIGMEFGASEDQEALDTLVTGEEYDPNLARELMFNYNVIFPYKEYMDIYRMVWELNRKLPESATKMRVLNLSYRYDWKDYPGYRTIQSTAKVFHKGGTERFRAELINREIFQQGMKLLVITGTVHAFTRYAMPVYDFLEEGFVRLQNGFMGNLLYQMAPEKVCTVLLHFMFNEQEVEKGNRLPADGQIEALMAAFGNKPMGFDLINTPVGWLHDHSYLAFGHPDFKLEDLADGYVFLKPLSQQSGCTVDYDFLKGHTLEEIQEQYPDPEWHPPLHSMEDYWKLVEDYVDLKKRHMICSVTQAKN